MNERYKYEAYYKKVQSLCEENELVFRIRKDSYPISMTVRRMSGPGQQLMMLEMAEEKGYTSPDATLVFYYKDGDLSWKTSETFNINEALFAKLKNLFKNLHSCWLQFFFRNVMELQLLSRDEIPVIEDTETTGGEDANLPEVDLSDEDEDSEEDLLDEDDVPALSYDADDLQVAVAARVVRETGRASVSLLMREMNCGHATAAALLDALEAAGVIGPYKGAEPREVLPWNDGEEVSCDE